MITNYYSTMILKTGILIVCVVILINNSSVSYAFERLNPVPVKHVLGSMRHGTTYIFPDYYACVAGNDGLGQCVVLTSERKSLRIVYKVWIADRAFPLNVDQTSMLLIHRGFGGLSFISLVNEKYEMLRQWIVASDQFSMTPLENGLFLVRNWMLLDPNKDAFEKFADISFAERLKIAGDFVLSYGVRKASVYKYNQLVYTTDENEWGAEISASGACIIGTWEKAQEAGKDAIRFFYYSPEGKKTEIAKTAMGGRIMAMSPNGRHLLVGTVDDLYLIHVQDLTVKLKIDLPINILPTQQIVTDAGEVFLWEFLVKLVQEKEIIEKAFIEFIDAAGKRKQIIDVPAIPPATATVEKSFVLSNSTLDLLTSAGIIRFEIE